MTFSFIDFMEKEERRWGGGERMKHGFGVPFIQAFIG